MSKSPPKEPEAKSGVDEQAPERVQKNIIWVGVKPPAIVDDAVAAARTPETVDPWVDLEPPPAVYLPDFPMGLELPDAATQRAGFYHPNAGRIIQDVAGYVEWRANKGRR